MKYILFTAVLLVAACKHTLSDKAKARTIEVLEMMKQGGNEEVLDLYYGIEMNDQNKQVFLEMQESVKAKLNTHGIPEPGQIDVTQERVKPNKMFASDFPEDSITIVSTRTQLTAQTGQSVIEMMFVEKDSELRLLNIGMRGAKTN